MGETHPLPAVWHPRAGDQFLALVHPAGRRGSSDPRGVLLRRPRDLLLREHDRRGALRGAPGRDRDQLSGPRQPRRLEGAVRDGRSPLGVRRESTAHRASRVPDDHGHPGRLRVRGLVRNAVRPLAPRHTEPRYDFGGCADISRRLRKGVTRSSAISRSRIVIRPLLDRLQHAAGAHALLRDGRARHGGGGGQLLPRRRHRHRRGRSADRELGSAAIR